MNKLCSAVLTILFWAFIGFIAIDVMEYIDGGYTLKDIFSKENKVVHENKNNVLVDKKENDSSKEDVEPLNRSKVIFYPYFEMLEEKEKTIYNQVYDNAKKRNTSFKPLEEVSVEQMKRIMEAVYNDHPELFWLDSSFEYRYTDDLLCTEVILNFNDTIEYFEQANAEFEKVVNEIVSYAKDLENDYEKERYVHNMLIGMIEYDEKAELNQSAYSAIVNKKTVCAGYARAFQHIMIILGVPTYYVTGDAEGNHAWNIINIAGVYYNVDLTWNDNEYDVYSYFNLTDEEFSSSHTRSRVSSLLPKCEV